MREDKLDYDVQKRVKAGTTATFRAIVSAYLIYLAWTVLRGVLNGSSPIPPWIGWLAALCFTAAAIAFALFTRKTYLRDRELARLSDPSEKETEKIET